MIRIICGIWAASLVWLSATPSIKSLGDLQNLEAKVQKVVAQATPATISLLSNQVRTTGSGVIVSEDGLILTAAHVVQGSGEMTVIFPDGREERAKVLGANHTRDAALAQLIGDGPWPFVEVGDSDPLKVGDFVIAMGHPKGYDPTRRPPVRFGRVMTRGGQDFITTDCAVIGGDSGGPLFDLEGKVIGIHSHINVKEVSINNHAGISGFKKSWKKMLRGDQWGRLGGRNPRRPVIGVMLDTQADGLVVAEVVSRSPAQKAGMQSGDRITHVNDVGVSSGRDLADYLIDYEVGDTISTTLQRGDEIITSEITLAGQHQIYRRSRR